jgi:multiple sugar transport system permease protein
MSGFSSQHATYPARFKSRKLQKRMDALLSYLALTVVLLVLLSPFFVMVSTSFMTSEQAAKYPPTLIPDPVTFSNYPAALLRQQPFFAYLANTLIIAFLALTGDLLSSSFIAYGFSRLRFPGRDLLFGLLLSTLMVPLIVKLVPLFVLFRQLGWLNTFLPLVVPSFLGTPFFIFLMRQFFLTIPTELNEAARLDGASEIRIWWQIYMPLSKPALAVVAIFSFQNVWNDFLGPLVYLTKPEVKTVILGLFGLLGMFMETNTVMAGAVAVIVPMVALFLVFQRYFVKGVAVTGLKG